MQYPISEKFKAPQGEGLYTGTPMAFIRFVGCSVGKKTCRDCDTDFETMHESLGGGKFSPEELLEWVGEYEHICLTGGEPLDRDLIPFLSECYRKTIHIETSGTVEWMKPFIAVGADRKPRFSRVWLTVSPKPGYRKDLIDMADEIKVIVGGLGSSVDGWPTIADAVEWAKRGKLVYIQPRNHKTLINKDHMREALEITYMWPILRLSAQLHKYIGTR